MSIFEIFSRNGGVRIEDDLRDVHTAFADGKKVHDLIEGRPLFNQTANDLRRGKGRHAKLLEHLGIVRIVRQGQSFWDTEFQRGQLADDEVVLIVWR